MNIDNLTYGEIKEIVKMLSLEKSDQALDNKMIGKYVIVRSRDAGVHSGIL